MGFSVWGIWGLQFWGTGFENYGFMAVSLDGLSICIVLHQKQFVGVCRSTGVMEKSLGGSF